MQIQPRRLQFLKESSFTDKKEIERLALCQTYQNAYAFHMTRSSFARAVLKNEIPGVKSLYHEDHIVRILRQARQDVFSAVVDGRHANSGKRPKKSTDTVLQGLMRGLRRELGTSASMPTLRGYIIARYPRYKKYSLRAFYRAWGNLSAIEQCASIAEWEDCKSNYAPLATPLTFNFGDVVFGDWMKVAKHGLEVVDDNGRPIEAEVLGHYEGASRACCGILLCPSPPTTENVTLLAEQVVFGKQCAKLGLAESPMVPKRWHTDRGSSYTAHSYMAVFRDAKILHTFSRPQTPTDNAHIERFWGTLRYLFRRTLLTRLRLRMEPSRKKGEQPKLKITYSDLKRLLAETVRFYNCHHFQSAIGMTPAAAWKNGVAQLAKKSAPEELKFCFRMRKLVKLRNSGTFRFRGQSYYCRGVNRLKGQAAIVTWQAGGVITRLRLYIKGEFRGIAHLIEKSSRADGFMRASYEKDCDTVMAENNEAGAKAREHLLKDDPTYDGHMPALGDHDMHAAREDRKKRRVARAEKLRVADAKREKSADRLRINRPPPVEPADPKPKRVPRSVKQPESPKPRTIRSKTTQKYAK